MTSTPVRRGRTGLPWDNSRSLAWAVALVLLLVSPLRAATWVVNPDGSADATRISDGLALASAGDTVGVTCGTYYERAIVLKSGVVLTSETGQADCVTIDAQQFSRIFYASGVDANAALIGFTLINGKANYGGAMYCGSGSYLSIRNCVFADNSGTVGGALYVHHSNPTITDCVFTGNASNYWGGGIAIEDLAEPHLERCTISGNYAARHGGGIFSYLWTNPEFVDCTISGNYASHGGGIAAIGGSLTLRDTFVTGNNAEYGGGLSLAEAAATFESCTIADNAALVEGGGIDARDIVTAGFTRSILWGNCAPLATNLSVVHAASTFDFACSSVGNGAGWKSGSGAVTWTGANLNLDPQFCAATGCGVAAGPASGYGLSAASPCLPGASGGCGRIGAQTTDCATANPYALTNRPEDVQ